MSINLVQRVEVGSLSKEDCSGQRKWRSHVGGGGSSGGSSGGGGGGSSSGGGGGGGGGNGHVALSWGGLRFSYLFR